MSNSNADVMLKFEWFIFLDWSSILRRGAETSASSWISWPSPPALFSHSGSYDFQGTVAPVWVWPKVELLERARIGDESLMVFKFFFSVSDFSLILIKPLCFEETDRKCLKYVETHWVIDWGVFVLPIGWKRGGKCARWVSTFIWAFPKVSPLFWKHWWKAL